jgi:hypothetical protein
MESSDKERKKSVKLNRGLKIQRRREMKEALNLRLYRIRETEMSRRLKAVTFEFFVRLGSQNTVLGS